MYDLKKNYPENPFFLQNFGQIFKCPSHLSKTNKMVYITWMIQVVFG